MANLGDFNIPVISFFTFGACAAAMEWGAWKSLGGCSLHLSPGEIHLIPGLPVETNITYHDLARRRAPPVPLVEGSIAFMFNTCEDLEHTFITYLANQMGLPVWGVGPLLPSQNWSKPNSLIQGFQIRQPNKNQNNKPEKSVLYVAFGSEKWHIPLIWVVLNCTSMIGNILDNLDKKIDDRGLIVRGWAPQLLILSHPSTGGFLSHCRWNSTLEARGCGVPVLAWPIRGNHIYNAKLVANHLKIGYIALPRSTITTKDDLISGIDKLMTDEDVRKQAEVMRAKFSVGFSI
ncbi:hypothetical protein ACP275_01G054500 [Erythranthe tilingii]